VSARGPEGVYIHPTALVESAALGAGTHIWAFSHVMDGATLGRDCAIGDHCFVEGGARIGDGVTIKNNNSVWEGVTLGDGVFVGPAVTFTNDVRPRSPRSPHGRSRYGDRSWLVPTLVGTGATIGAGAIIIAGVEIGSFAMIGAGSVVTRDVPPYRLVVGNPGRTRGWVCACGDPLETRGAGAACTACGRSYTLRDGTLSPHGDADSARTR